MENFKKKCVLFSQSSGKLEMERGMVKPMIRGEQQDSRWDGPLYIISSFFMSSFFLLFSCHLTVWFSLFRSQDMSGDRTELTLPASIEFRDNCKKSAEIIFLITL